MLALLQAAAAASVLPLAYGRELSGLQTNLGRVTDASVTYSKNVSHCPGYALSSVRETSSGLTANLNLAGAPCTAFGQDIKNLTIQVSYEDQTRLHVNIYDAAKTQFTVPTSIIAPPGTNAGSKKATADLVFNYQSSPFAFWITRRTNPKAAPLFDTRISSLPKTPIPPVTSDNSTALDGFPLVFEDSYLQLTSALPKNTNIYGLGEVIASSGIRRDIAVNGSIQTDWARDVADPVDANEYGIHPFYLEHRQTGTDEYTSHGVFIASAAGADILLLTPSSSNVSLIEYRMLGGVLDFYFFSGPTPQAVVQQYSSVVGTPGWQPMWGFGFHLCRWGYAGTNATAQAVASMRAANIPLETMWNDIDLYDSYRDFTTDPVVFPAAEHKAFIDSLHAAHQHYIPIVDAAVAHTINNGTDYYAPYSSGHALDTFIKNPDGSEYIGQVWPGYTVFPDWFAPNTEAWWTDALRNWSALGVEFDGIWLDMNEASSFCTGSCGSSAFANSTKRGLGAAAHSDIDVNTPPYTINNGGGPLSTNTLATNATHYGGYLEYDTHNIFGTMEEITTNAALRTLRPNQRPFIIGRSTFAGVGKYSGHWLGDNFSVWEYLHYMIQGVLQFQMFQVPMVGADTCGFNDDSNEQLCNRWMQAAAFTPFYRNHNTKGAAAQEPYVWESVANASRIAIAARYKMLPYWYTLFANVSRYGTPPVRPLFFEFPNDASLFSLDSQWLIGSDILVTPVITENATTVTGAFPGTPTTVWRDWWTHATVNVTNGQASLDAPLGHINVHVRDGSALLLYNEPAYTIAETAAGPYELLVHLSPKGTAQGTAYVDDLISDPPGPATELFISAAKNTLSIKPEGKFNVTSHLGMVTLLGAPKPKTVSIGGKSVNFTYDASVQSVVVRGLSVDLNKAVSLSWK